MTPQSIVQFIWLLGAMVEIAFIAIIQSGWQWLLSAGCGFGSCVFVLVQLFVGEVIASDIIWQLFLDQEFISIGMDHEQSKIE